MKTKNLFLTFILVLLISLSARSGPVGKEAASTVAKNFFYERISPSNNIGFEKLNISSDYTVKYKGLAVYYIFNFQNGGFIVVSAIDNVLPVICYSFKGHYDDSSQPENFRAWMLQYQMQIRDAIIQKSIPEPEVKKTWEYYLSTSSSSLKAYSGREILPLLSSNWNQNKFYNEACPEDPMGPGGHCYAGCVATALGQLMNYFRFPENGTGSYTYECPPYGNLSADFENTSYEWDLMEGSISHSNLPLATLLYHLGVSVDMAYGPDGSGMYNHKGAYTLRTYFKYMPETEYVFRDSTSLDWDSLLVSSLDRRIPLYYAGWDVPDTSGHAFICDAYQEGSYYHFNWGWSGSYDGYFYTNNLNPGGSNFNLAQELIINAVPDTNQYNYPPYCQGLKTYTALYGSIEDGSGPLFPYQNQASAAWLIMPDDSVNSITLTFQRFQTDTNDHVNVYDGEDNTAPLLGTFSGDEIPPAVTSSGSKMYITFESGAENVGEGWLADFSSNLPDYCLSNQVLTGFSDTITDGSGSWDYHNNTACLWMISPPGASSITLNFLDFETEEGKDFLQIFDPQSQVLLAKYSGSFAPGVPDPVTSPSGKIFLAFNTNYSGRAAGWTAYYDATVVGMQESSLPGDVKIYPNPNDGKFRVILPEEIKGKTEISIIDLAGKNIYSQIFSVQESKHQIRVVLPGVTFGMYFLKVKDSIGRQSFLRLIIN